MNIWLVIFISRSRCKNKLNFLILYVCYFVRYIFQFLFYKILRVCDTQKCGKRSAFPSIIKKSLSSTYSLLESEFPIYPQVEDWNEGFKNRGFPEFEVSRSIYYLLNKSTCPFLISYSQIHPIVLPKEKKKTNWFLSN